MKLLLTFALVSTSLLLSNCTSNGKCIFSSNKKSACCATPASSSCCATPAAAACKTKGAACKVKH